MTTQYIHTTLNGQPSDTVPVEDGKLLDALYDVYDRTTLKVGDEYMAGVEAGLQRGDKSGTVFLGGLMLEWTLASHE